MNIHTISSEKINFIIFDAHARVYSVRNKVLVMASAMYPSFYLQLIKVKIIINLLSFSIEPSIKYQIVFVLNIHVEHFSALSLLWHCSLLLWFRPLKCFTVQLKQTIVACSEVIRPAKNIQLFIDNTGTMSTHKFKLLLGSRSKLCFYNFPFSILGLLKVFGLF